MNAAPSDAPPAKAHALEPRVGGSLLVTGAFGSRRPRPLLFFAAPVPAGVAAFELLALAVFGALPHPTVMSSALVFRPPFFTLYDHTVRRRVYPTDKQLVKTRPNLAGGSGNTET